MIYKTGFSQIDTIMKTLTQIKRPLWCAEIYVLLVIVVSGAISYTLYNNSTKKLKEFSQRALKEVLHRELEKRSSHEMIRSNVRTITLTRDSFPRPCYIRSVEGEKKYNIEYEQYEQNIADNRNLRIDHSHTLSHNPFILDSLSYYWIKILKEKYSSVKATLHIIYSGGIDKPIEKEWKSTDSILINSFYELPPCYIGYASEYKVTGFIVSPSWFTTWYFPLFIFLLCIGMGGGYRVRLFISKLSLQKNNRTEIEETPLVSSCQNKLLSIYYLKDNLCYNASNKCIVLEENEFPIKGYFSNSFLEAILKTPNHTLSDKEIFEIGWPDGSGNFGKLQTAISRLRTKLANITPNIKVERKTTAYQLKIE